MKAAGVGMILLSFVPISARGQSAELTLNCRYETAYDIMKNRNEEMSGGFSAIVRMSSANNPVATIEATTFLCGSYEGTFSDLEVSGKCERTLAGDKMSATLTVDRISGAFEHDVFQTKSAVIYSGLCTPAKKLF
jgi:hypothetical protein